MYIFKDKLFDTAKSLMVTFVPLFFGSLVFLTFELSLEVIKPLILLSLFFIYIFAFDLIKRVIID